MYSVTCMTETMLQFRVIHQSTLVLSSFKIKRQGHSQHLPRGEVGEIGPFSLSTLPNHYAQMDVNYGKNAYWTSDFVSRIFFTESKLSV